MSEPVAFRPAGKTANLARAIVEQAAARPGLRLGTVDEQVALGDAVELAAGRARALLGAGLAPGQRVALVAPASTDYVITWLACLLAGTPVALVNPTYPDELTRRMLAPLAPDLVLDAGPVALARALDLRPADRVLAPLPPFHINPMGYGIITALLTGADALTVRKFSASEFWPAVVGERVTVLILHAPPVQILKRATSARDAAGHWVRTMFYADAGFLAQFGVPAAVSGYGSTEAGGISHLTRWSASGDIPADASRHGGRGRPDIEWRLDDRGVILVRERSRAALFDGYAAEGGIDPARDAGGWFDTGDLGRADGDDYLVFLERAAESIRVKGEFVPIPYVENHLAAVAGLSDHALWKRPGALVDEEVVLYAVADPLPLDQLRQRIADLPAFMRPVAVARVGALPRDAAVGKVQRRLLGEQPVLDWVELP